MNHALLILAHAGHADSATFSSGWLHPLAGWDHLLAMVAVGLWAVQRGGAALWQLPATFVSAMALGCGLALSGLPLPGMEWAVTGSVLAFGLFVAWGDHRIASALPYLVTAIFAVFHGFAHGVELPASGSAGLYVTGFLIATGALHAAGIGLGAALLSLPFRERAIQYAGVAIAVAGVGLTIL